MEIRSYRVDLAAQLRQDLKNGSLDSTELQKLRDRQRDNTGFIQSMESAENGGWKVEFPRLNKNLSFTNQADAMELCKAELGLIYRDESKKELVAGETIDSIINS